MQEMIMLFVTENLPDDKATLEVSLNKVVYTTIQNLVYEGIKSDTNYNKSFYSRRSSQGTNKSRKSKKVVIGQTKKIQDLTKKSRTLEEAKAIAAQSQADMKKLIATEVIIEKILIELDCDPWDDLDNWPPDAILYKGM